MEDNQLENWIPHRLIEVDGKLFCTWLNTFGEPFTEPFFQESALKCLSLCRDYDGLKSVSDLMMMKEWAQRLNAVEPGAFIFHISRCGSTLVSQLLATVEEYIVLSEVPFFDDLLRLKYKNRGFNEAFINDLLVAAIKYYGQKRTNADSYGTASKQHLFIKADSWHLFFYKQLRQLYPSVPFIFIYRSPDEVLGSHSKLRGMQAVPGLIEPELFGFKKDEIGFSNLDLYLSKVLESYFNQCLKIAETDEQFLLLNYSEGPMQMIEKIAAFANISLSRQDLSNMKERSLYHSKKPGEHFSEDAVVEIPPCLNNAMELYRSLEEKRMAITSS